LFDPGDLIRTFTGDFGLVISGETFEGIKGKVKPWNPIIANVFYRAGIIERWGSGTLNIIEWCAENGNPPPTWTEEAGSVFVTFAPATSEVTPQAGTKLALSRHQVEILHKCREDSMLVELMAITGRSDRTKFRHQVLNPL